MKTGSDILTLVTFGFVSSLAVVIVLYCMRKSLLIHSVQLAIIGAYLWALCSVGLLLVNKQNTRKQVPLTYQLNAGRPIAFHPWYFRGLYEMETGNVASTVGHLYPYSKAVELSDYIIRQVDSDNPNANPDLPVDLCVNNMFAFRRFELEFLQPDRKVCARLTPEMFRQRSNIGRTHGCCFVAILESSCAQAPEGRDALPKLQIEHLVC